MSRLIVLLRGYFWNVNERDDGVRNRDTCACSLHRCTTKVCRLAMKKKTGKRKTARWQFIFFRLCTRTVRETRSRAKTEASPSYVTRWRAIDVRRSSFTQVEEQKLGKVDSRFVGDGVHSILARKRGLDDRVVRGADKHQPFIPVCIGSVPKGRIGYPCTVTRPYGNKLWIHAV